MSNKDWKNNNENEGGYWLSESIKGNQELNLNKKHCVISSVDSINSIDSIKKGENHHIDLKSKEWILPLEKEMTIATSKFWDFDNWKNKLKLTRNLDYRNYENENNWDIDQLKIKRPYYQKYLNEISRGLEPKKNKYIYKFEHNTYYNNKYNSLIPDIKNRHYDFDNKKWKYWNEIYNDKKRKDPESVNQIIELIYLNFYEKNYITLTGKNDNWPLIYGSNLLETSERLNLNLKKPSYLKIWDESKGENINKWNLNWNLNNIEIINETKLNWINIILNWENAAWKKREAESQLKYWRMLLSNKKKKLKEIIKGKDREKIKILLKGDLLLKNIWINIGEWKRRSEKKIYNSRELIKREEKNTKYIGKEKQDRIKNRRLIWQRNVIKYYRESLKLHINDIKGEYIEQKLIKIREECNKWEELLEKRKEVFYSCKKAMVRMNNLDWELKKEIEIKMERLHNWYSKYVSFSWMSRNHYLKMKKIENPDFKEEMKDHSKIIELIVDLRDDLVNWPMPYLLNKRWKEEDKVNQEIQHRAEWNHIRLLKAREAEIEIKIERKDIDKDLIKVESKIINLIKRPENWNELKEEVTWEWLNKKLEKYIKLNTWINMANKWVGLKRDEKKNKKLFEKKVGDWLIKRDNKIYKIVENIKLLEKLIFEQELKEKERQRDLRITGHYKTLTERERRLAFENSKLKKYDLLSEEGLTPAKTGMFELFGSVGIQKFSKRMAIKKLEYNVDKFGPSKKWIETPRTIRKLEVEIEKEKEKVLEDKMVRGQVLKVTPGLIKDSKDWSEWEKSEEKEQSKIIEEIVERGEKGDNLPIDLINSVIKNYGKKEGEKKKIKVETRNWKITGMFFDSTWLWWSNLKKMNMDKNWWWSRVETKKMKKTSNKGILNSLLDFKNEIKKEGNHKLAEYYRHEEQDYLNSEEYKSTNANPYKPFSYYKKKIDPKLKNRKTLIDLKENREKFRKINLRLIKKLVITTNDYLKYKRERIEKWKESKSILTTRYKNLDLYKKKLRIITLAYKGQYKKLKGRKKRSWTVSSNFHIFDIYKWRVGQNENQKWIIKNKYNKWFSKQNWTEWSYNNKFIKTNKYIKTTEIYKSLDQISKINKRDKVKIWEIEERSFKEIKWSFECKNRIEKVQNLKLKEVADKSYLWANVDGKDEEDGKDKWKKSLLFNYREAKGENGPDLKRLERLWIQRLINIRVEKEFHFKKIIKWMENENNSFWILISPEIYNLNGINCSKWKKEEIIKIRKAWKNYIQYSEEEEVIQEHRLTRSIPSNYNKELKLVKTRPIKNFPNLKEDQGLTRKWIMNPRFEHYGVHDKTIEEKTWLKWLKERPRMNKMNSKNEHTIEK